MAPPLEILKGTFAMCCNSHSSPPRPLSSHSNEILMGDSVNSDPSNLAQLPTPTSPLDGVIKYFNDYGFTYVGIYREGFQVSSSKATEVFKEREWVGVVSDRLVPHVLGLISAFITLGSGCFGLVVEEFDAYSFTNFHQPNVTAFCIGCSIGLLVSTVCLKVVASSVSTILVCFSLAPWKFHINHPVLSKEMRTSWGGIWLDEYDWLSNAERGGVERDEMMR